VILSVKDPAKFIAEAEAIGELVRSFAIQMVEKLLKKHVEGKRGWNDPGRYDYILDALYGAADRGEWLNVANYAAMLWNLDNKTGGGDSE
jgi:hypothetical protein